MSPRDESGSPRGPLSWALGGALLAAAWGAVELMLALQADADPSVARRAVAILQRTLLLHALVGAGLGLCAWPLARRLRVGGAACSLALATLFLALSAVDAHDLGGRLVGEEGRRWRYAGLVVAFVAALGAGWLATRLRPHVPAALRRASAYWMLPAALVLLGASARSAALRAPWPPPAPAGSSGAARGDVSHVLLIVVDTLRADALSCSLSPHGAPAGSTPCIDALAERGVLFEDVLAPSSWTLPSVATVLTGEDPFDHGVGEFSGVIAPGAPTLAELFRDAGYVCDAWLGNPLVTRRGGFDRGFRLFDCYDYDLEAVLTVQRAGWGLARLLGLVRYPRRLNPLLRLVPRAPWVETRPQRSSFDEDMLASLERFTPPDPDRPSFVYFQPVGPHDPYFERPATFGKERAPFLLAQRDELRALYAGEVRHLDAVVGELLELYRRAGILDRTLVVLTADHGEEFQEHGGWRHGEGLYGEVVAVPWIVAGPGVARGRRISQRVGLEDVAPTLLSLAGLEPPPNADGTDLAPLVRAGAEAPPPELPPRRFAQLTSRILNPGVAFYSVADGRWKIVREVHDEGPVRELVFDLQEDPLELSPLAEPPEELAPLRQALLAYEARAGRAEKPEDGALHDEQREDLEALGYAAGDR